MRLSTRTSWPAAALGAVALATAFLLAPSAGRAPAVKPVAATLPTPAHVAPTSGTEPEHCRPSRDRS